MIAEYLCNRCGQMHELSYDCPGGPVETHEEDDLDLSETETVLAEEGIVNVAQILYANRANAEGILDYLLPKLWAAVERLKQAKGLPIFPAGDGSPEGSPTARPMKLRVEGPERKTDGRYVLWIYGADPTPGRIFAALGDCEEIAYRLKSFERGEAKAEPSTPSPVPSQGREPVEMQPVACPSCKSTNVDPLSEKTWVCFGCNRTWRVTPGAPATGADQGGADA